MQLIEWTRPERAEVFRNGQWIKCLVVHRSDGYSVIDPTVNGLKHRMDEADAQQDH